MKRTLLSTALTLAFPLLVHAGNPGDDFHELYFSHDNPALTPQEKEGVKIGRQWQAASATGIKPVMGDNGAVQFLFGNSQPSIVCAVMQVCDVELQEGEQVNGVHLGDSVRWQVEPSITGYGPTEVQHLIIKPRDVGLDTSLVATTNRRTYHMRLRSHKTEFMPRVSFVYPEDAQAKWAAIREREVRERTHHSPLTTHHSPLTTHSFIDCTPTTDEAVVRCRSNMTSSFFPFFNQLAGQYTRCCGPIFQKRPSRCPFTYTMPLL